MSMEAFIDPENQGEDPQQIEDQERSSKQDESAERMKTLDLDPISLKDILLYSPYDNKTNLGDEEKDEYLFNELFVDIPEFHTYKEDVLKAINPSSNEFQSWYILSGYSGNGKTTFLNWFKREVSDTYYFQIINLVQKAVGHYDGESLIKENIRKQLNPMLKDSAALPHILNQDDGPILEFLDIRLPSDASGDPATNLWDGLDVLHTIIEDKSRSERERNRLIKRFTKRIPFTQLVVLYLLESLIRNYNKGYKSYTFCFDNLDEVEFKYMTEELWIQFLHIWDIMNAICQENFRELKIEFSQRVTIMLVFREANLAVSSAQFLDRIAPWYRNRRFIISDAAKEIIQKRMDFATRYLQGQDQTQHYEIARILNEEPYTNRVFLPLFNYDYRKLIQALLEIADNKIIEGAMNYTLLDVSYDTYKRIYQDEMTRNGARGIILHGLIKHLIDHNDLESFALDREFRFSPRDSHGYYRPSRMILTVICNLSYPDGFPFSPDTVKKRMARRVRLYELYKYISRFYDGDELFDWLPYFFMLEKASWAHLVSIYGKELKAGNGDAPHLSFEAEKAAIKKWKQGKINERKLEELLNRVELHINASAYIYLRYLVIHFEYFSSLSPYNSPDRRYKPLFLATNFIPEKKKYEFEIIINDILQQARTYKKNMDDFLMHRLKEENGMTVNQYGKSVYTFRKGQETHKTLYGSRVMTTHIRYLDNFRYHLLHSKEFKAYCAENEQLGGINLQRINKFLVGTIKKYVELLHRGLSDPTMESLIVELAKDVAAVEANNYAVDKWKTIGASWEA